MQAKAMRDIFLESLYEKMQDDEKIFFLSADFGSPVLDKIRADYPERFINIGIAEQNLINVATGLALEGFKVFVYGIAPFITMRCFEQIRVNISILSQIREMNINILAVGAGVSYSMSGPTHHCLEDISIMKTLPNIEVFSPSDYLLTKMYVARALEINKPKYIRLDAKPLYLLSESFGNFDIGFRILKEGKKNAIITTGYMSHKVNSIIQNFDIKHIDLYLLNSYDLDQLRLALRDVERIITIEEGFENSGGLDCEINYHFKDKQIFNFGLEKKYSFEMGDREFIHETYGLGNDVLLTFLNETLK